MKRFVFRPGQPSLFFFFFFFFCILVCLPKGMKTEMGFCRIVHRVPFCAGLLPPCLCALPPSPPPRHLFPSLLLYAGSLFVKVHMFHGGRKMPEREGRTCARAGTRGGGGQGLIKMVDGLRGPRGRSSRRKPGGWRQKWKEAGITRESDVGKCDSSVFIKINTVQEQGSAPRTYSCMFK